MPEDSDRLTMPSAAIPIQNLYYLLSYAWDVLPEAELVSADVSPEMRLQDLLASVLRRGVARLLKRGLDRAYVEHVEEIAGVRGRIAVGESLKRTTFNRARAVCRFDELSPDVAHNRIIKSTLRSLAAVRGLDHELALELRELYRRMPDVRETRVTAQSFRRVTLGRNTAFYRFLLDVCEIIHRNLLVEEGGTGTLFRDFTRDDDEMARLFERFLLRFYAHEQTSYAVSAPRFDWEAQGRADHLAYLPQMWTDIVLRNETETIVIDAKYYTRALTEHMTKATVRPGHLYQIFSYMSHLARSRPDKSAVRGILLYPRTTETVAVDVALFGHPFRAVTINLDQPWSMIRSDLLALMA